MLDIAAICLVITALLAYVNRPERDTVLSLTYCVVVFSILVQGLTVGRLARATVAQGRGGPVSDE
jgi:monovalent cation:H+ antiporter, CPA1 family